MKNITKEMIVRYFNTIMPHFHCQSQLQNDRYTFYCILHQIFLNRLEGKILICILYSLPNFIIGVIIQC